MQKQLNAVIEKHCETIKTSVATLGKLLDEVAAGAATDPLNTIQDAEGLAHQLKGSSGTAGFRDISQTATALDDHLKILCRGSADVLPAGIGQAMTLYRLLDEVTQPATPHTSTLYRAV